MVWKGVYHINAVDCVTQFQLLATCERISEAYLLPVIQQLFDQFLSTMLGFHANNGSEYVNYQVARLLESCASNSPGHDHDIPTRMLWCNPKTVPLCINIRVIPLFRNDLLKKSTHSALIFLTPMSISTVPASFLKPSLTQRVKSGKSIVTNT